MADQTTDSPNIPPDGQERLAQLLITERGRGFEPLLAGIVHAFNNALVSIQGANDLALAQVSPDSAVRRELDAVHASVAAAKELVGQLIVFSSGGAFQPAPARIEPLLQALMRALRILVPDRIAIELRCDPDLPAATIDELSIKRLVTGLVTNAKEAIHGTGTITIRAAAAYHDEAAITRHGGQQAGPHVRIAVEDDGSGIDPADLPRIFDPFFSRKRGGLGLGLATAYVTARRHDGFLTVESFPGRGTSIALHLPATAKPVAAAAPAATRSLEALKGAGERILIVEDEREVLGFVARALGRYGFDVTTAGSVAEAETLFRRAAGRYHLLFCDVALPDGNGYELADRLRREAPALAVLMTSGHTGGVAQSAHPFPFLHKPYGVTDLLAAIRTALAEPA